MSIAIALVRESSALMVGQYFKRRRDFVEIVVQMGAGIGVILFAVFFKEALGWVESSHFLFVSAFFFIFIHFFLNKCYDVFCIFIWLDYNLVSFISLDSEDVLVCVVCVCVVLTAFPLCRYLPLSVTFWLLSNLVEFFHNKKPQQTNKAAVVDVVTTSRLSLETTSWWHSRLLLVVFCFVLFCFVVRCHLERRFFSLSISIDQYHYSSIWLSVWFNCFLSLFLCFELAVACYCINGVLVNERSAAEEKCPQGRKCGVWFFTTRTNCFPCFLSHLIDEFFLVVVLVFLSQMGWRLGLQAATGLLLSAFFLGTFYRSASLYHPQRRAILHLKTQRKKVSLVLFYHLTGGLPWRP